MNQKEKMKMQQRTLGGEELKRALQNILQQQRRCGHDFFRFPTEPVKFTIRDSGRITWTHVIYIPPALKPTSRKTEVEEGNFPFKCQAPGFEHFL